MSNREDIRVFAPGGALGSISGVTDTLPAGLTLGEERVVGGVRYRLMYNAAANSTVDRGLVASPVGVGGPYSCSITTTSASYNAYGAVVCNNQTAATGDYFWGAYNGYPVKMQAGTASIATDSTIMVSVLGTVSSFITGVTAVAAMQRHAAVAVGKLVGAENATSTGLTGASASGDYFISFPDFGAA